jgi:dsRNA-specific ribonuclease
MGDRAARMNPSTYKVLQIPALPDDIYLPPLPPIGNKDIEKRVFTHSSMISQARARVKFVEEDHELLDNEKLEWVGDGILSGLTVDRVMGDLADELEMVCTTLLHRLFPNMKEGPTTVS